jgi:hypothetical protein
MPPVEALPGPGSQPRIILLVARGGRKMPAPPWVPIHRSHAALRSALAGIGLIALLATGGARAASLTVHVSDGQTGAPLAGAFVMLGLYEGDPFDGNLGWTDAAGTVRFDDPALAGPQTVTAGAAGLGYTTLYAAAVGEVSLPLFPAVMDSTLGGRRTRVEGTVADIGFTNNDGKLDVALVMPAVDPANYIFMDMFAYLSEPEPVTFPIGTVTLPGNVYMPDQIELLFAHFVKTPWRMDVAAGQSLTFFSASARIAISDLLGGTVAQNMVVREIGVERDVPVSGPMQLTIHSDIDLTRSLTASFFNVPPGNDLLTVSGAQFSSGGRELGIGYDTRGGLVDSVSSFSLSSCAPTGDLQDAVNIAVGAYADSSLAIAYSAGIIDRSGFVPPHTSVFSTWMLLPVVSQNGRYFGWEDPTNPGVSPAPTWTRSNLGLRAVDPADSTVPVSTWWRVYAAAGPRHFVLPLLPAVAPGPPGGLPDPAQTGDDDRLYWTFVAADPGGTGAEIVTDFIHEATHWTQRWIGITPFPTTDAPEPPAPACALQVAPNPASGETRLRWSVPAPGAATLEVRGVDGRLVRGIPLAGAGGEARWDGRDAHGRRVPAGIYWVRLTHAGERLGDARRLVLLRGSP